MPCMAPKAIHLSLQRRVEVVKRLVSHTLDKSLQPRALRLATGELVVEIRVSVTVNAILGRSVLLAFVGVVKPGTPSAFHCKNIG
jgi:hypothetical protein